MLQLLGVEQGLFMLSCILKNIDDDFNWVFTGVYGPTSGEIRDRLWEELGAIKGFWVTGGGGGGDSISFGFLRREIEEVFPSY